MNRPGENAIGIVNAGNLTHHVLILIMLGAAVWSATWCACCGCYLAAGKLAQARSRRQASDRVRAEARRGMREIEIFLGAGPDSALPGTDQDVMPQPERRRGQRGPFRRDRGSQP